MAVELVELGRTRYMGQTIGSSPVVRLFRVVDFLEDPFKGMELDPDEKITARQVSVANRLNTISKLTRRGLVKDVGLEGLSYSSLMSEAMRLAAVLNEMDNELFDLGKRKSLGKRLKKVGKKVMKVVKSPAFLSVIGVAANLIPGVGQLASAGLMTAAGIMAQKQKQAQLKKETKKAEQQAAAQEAEQLEAMYTQYESNFSSWGYTREVWSKLTQAEKAKVIGDASAGTLVPYGTAGQASPAAQQIAATNPTASSEVAQAAGLSQAMQSVYGSALPGQGVDVSMLPPNVQAEANHAKSEYQKEIETVGKDNFLATALKATGQGGALDAFLKGAGIELPGGLSDILSQVTGREREVGNQDLKNMAAAAGAGDVVDLALDKGGPSKFPIVPVAIGGGVIIAVTAAAIILSR